MKTTKEILWDNLTFMGEDNPEWRLDDVLEAMREYAKQAIDKCAEEVKIEIETGVKGGVVKTQQNYFIGAYDVHYDDTTITPYKPSILNVKKLLK